MITRSILLAALVVASACRATPEEKSSDTAGHNLEDSAGQADTAEDTGVETGVVDTDTAQETDTATDETGDTAEPDCTFELVASGNGRIEVNNELRFSLAECPSDAVYDGLQAVFCFNVTSLHPECGTVAADTASFNIEASDNNGGENHWASGVRIEMVDLTIDPSAAVMTGTTVMNTNGDIYGPHSGILAVPAGDTHTFAVFMDTSGASSGDMLKLALRRYMHIVDSPESASAVMMNDDLEGGELTL